MIRAYYIQPGEETEQWKTTGASAKASFGDRQCLTVKVANFPYCDLDIAPLTVMDALYCNTCKGLKRKRKEKAGKRRNRMVTSSQFSICSDEALSLSLSDYTLSWHGRSSG
jgi:hypothetical protein